VAIVPEVPAEGRLDKVMVESIDSWHHAYSLVSPLERHIPACGRGIPGPGKVTFTDSLRSSADDETEVRCSYVELYVDGSAFAATPVLERTAEENAERLVGLNTIVDDGILLTDLVVRWTANRAGTLGTATVVTGLLDADSADAQIALPVKLAIISYGTLGRIRGTRSVSGRPRAITAVDLSSVYSQQERLSVTYFALSGILQWFGLAEPHQLKPDGSLVAQNFNVDYRQIQRWANAHEVAVEMPPGT